MYVLLHFVLTFYNLKQFKKTIYMQFKKFENQSV